MGAINDTRDDIEVCCGTCKHKTQLEDGDSAVLLSTVECTLINNKTTTNYKIVWEVCDKWDR